MTTYTEAERFLQAVFGGDHGTHAIFANLHPAVHTRNLQGWTRGGIATGPSPRLTRASERTLTRALEVRALVIDDVGTKVMAGAVESALGLPTAVVETSLRNCQWAYRLSKPVPVADWAAFFGGVCAMIGQKLDASAAQTLLRLPLGVNTKKGKGRFAVRLVELNPLILFGPARVTPIAPSGPGPSGLGLEHARQNELGRTPGLDGDGPQRRHIR